MENVRLFSLEEVFYSFIEGENKTFYFANEDAVYKIVGVEMDADASSCGFCFKCEVYSVYCNAEGLSFGDISYFLLDKTDKIYDFNHRLEASKDRAKIMAKAMIKAEWYEDQED